MAVEIEPAQILRRLSDAIASKQLRIADSLANAGFEYGIRHPLIYIAKALRFSELGKEEDALASFKEAQNISPPSASLESAIGLSLLKLDRAEEAVSAFAVAIALAPGSAQLHCRKGWAHELARDLDMARRAHESAVALQPDFAESLGRLSYLAAQRGDWQETRAMASRALAVDNLQPTAHLALAQLEIERGDFDLAELRLQSLLTRGNDRYYLSLGLLADLRDRQGRIAEAFELYTKANSEFESLHKQHALMHSGSMPEIASSLAEYIEKKAVSSPSNIPISNPLVANHVFILGFLRSGTTLLEQILASNTAAVTLEEKDTLQDATRAFMATEKSLGLLWSAQPEELAKYRALYWERVRQYGVDPENKTFVDKVPINTIKIPLIAHLFPDARIIFAVRDPRDVVLSCFRNRFQFNAVTREFLTLDRTAKFYGAVMRLAECYRQKIAFNELIIRHEDLVENFDRHAFAICAFTGLSFEASMRDFSIQARKRAISTVSAAQLSRGLNAEGVGRWRRYAKQLEPVMPILMPWVNRFGYAAN